MRQRRAPVAKAFSKGLWAPAATIETARAALEAKRASEDDAPHAPCGGPLCALPTAPTS